VKVGILAFHGDFSEHKTVLGNLGITSVEVRTVDALAGVQKLIIPGGESTVIAKFLSETKLDSAIIKRVRKKSLSIFGTCAGAIILARKITGKNAPKSLALIDVTLDRNAYGAQLQSFEASIDVKDVAKSVDVAFIRAPIITGVGRRANVLAKHGKNPVIVRQKNILIATCHPEVRGETRLHKYFLSM